jgi:uncharacterized membrane protein
VVRSLAFHDRALLHILISPLHNRVFWALSILAGLVTLAGIFVIPTPPPKTVLEAGTIPPRITSVVDFPGATLVTVGLLCLMFALSEGNVVGWSKLYIPVLIVLSVLLLTAFVIWQRYLERYEHDNEGDSGKRRWFKQPLMRTSIWQNPRFSAAQIIMLLFFAAFNNFLVYATYFYQEYQGLSIIQTTLRFIPTGAVGLFTALLSSQILGRIKGVYVLVWGCTCVALACLLFAVPIKPSTSYFAYGLEAMSLSVFGADTVYPCLTLFTVQSLPPEHQAMGGGIVNAVGQLGRTLGLAIAVAVETSVRMKALSNGVMEKEALLQGYRAAEYLSFGMGAAALAIAAVAFRKAGVVAHKK